VLASSISKSTDYVTNDWASNPDRRMDFPLPPRPNQL